MEIIMSNDKLFNVSRLNATWWSGWIEWINGKGGCGIIQIPYQ
jgi:hypothetical protein